MNLYNNPNQLSQLSHPSQVNKVHQTHRLNQEPLIIPDDNPNIVESEFHTLFMEEVPVTFDQLFMEDGPVEGIYEKSGGYNIYKLFIGGFADSGKGTQKIVNKLQQAQHTALELHISSEGGSFDEVVEYYDVISSYFSGVTSFLSYGYSAGAIAFLFADDRIVYEHSSWMIHSYSGFMGGKRADMLDQIKHSDDRIQKFFERMLKPYFNRKELKKMAQGQDYWLNSEQMLERGIATSIIVNGERFTAQEHLENLYPKRKEKRLKKEATDKKKSEKAEKKALKSKKAQKDKKKSKKKTPVENTPSSPNIENTEGI